MQKTQLKDFIKTALQIFLYALFGNVLALVMTISMTFIYDYIIGKIFVAFLCLLILYSLVFTAAYMGGRKDELSVRLNRIPKLRKKMWLNAGVLVSVIYCIMPISLLINKLISGEMSYLMFCLLNGSLYPIALIFSEINILSMPIAMPFVYICIYLLFILLVSIGYKWGTEGKLDKGKIMYK